MMAKAAKTYTSEYQISLFLNIEGEQLNIVTWNNKERTSVGSIRGLNLAVVRPTTVQLTNCSFRVDT
jgi:hypothetical protein